MTTKRKPVRHISVTLDFLRTFPDLDVTKERDLHVALYRVGFDVTRDDNGSVKDLKPFTMLQNKNVRCANLPYTYRKTLIFVGDMRQEFEHEFIYRNIDILDVGVYSGNDIDLVTDLPYDIPVVEKANTRKYTKKSDRQDSVDISFDNSDLAHLENIMGQED